MQASERNKGPIPRRYLWRYRGAEPRSLAVGEQPGS
jgi:hypothetical protein